MAAILRDPTLAELINSGSITTKSLPKYDPKKTYKEAIRKQLRVQDEQVAVNRYKWYNLPSGLDGQLLERILYYRGQGAFFFMPTNGKFYFLPYALAGSVDVYGRFMEITPLQFAGGTTTDASGKEKP